VAVWRLIASGHRIMAWLHLESLLMNNSQIVGGEDETYAF
jgi:hypothetical protein